MRKAQGILYIANKYPKDIVATASQAAIDNYRHLSPKIFKAIIEKLMEPKEISR